MSSDKLDSQSKGGVGDGLHKDHMLFSNSPHSGASKPTDSKPGVGISDPQATSSTHDEASVASPNVTKSRDLSQEALNGLPPEIKIEIGKLIPGNTESKLASDHIHAMVALVKTKESQCKGKLWKIKIKGKDIVF